MRFEVVSAPMEERLQSTFKHQTDVAVETLHTIMQAVNAKTNTTLNTTIAAVSDPIYMQSLYKSARALLAPSSIPGALLVVACLLRILRELVVHKLAKSECARVRAREKCD